MSAASALEAAPAPARGIRRPTAWRLLMNNRLAAAGFWVIAFIVVVALLAPLLPLHDPNVTSPANRLLPVFSGNHPLGTDHLGRDVLARLIWGTRVDRKSTRLNS